MQDSFLTLNRQAQTEIMIKKSRFLTSAAPVGSGQEAVSLINEIRSAHNKANHNVFAYIIDGQEQKFSDDGEPAGTAGMPVLEILTHKGLVQAVVVVTRYFGGIKLGAGGLVRAYKQAAVDGIAAAGVKQKLLHRELLVTMEYSHLGMVKNEIEACGGRQIDLSYGEKVIMKVLLRPVEIEKLTTRLTNATAAQINIQQGEFAYLSKK